MLPHALLILRRCALRHWRLAWRQQLVLLIILALGTAVFVAMRLANEAALAGFEKFTDGVTQAPDWRVQSVGGPMSMESVRAMREALGSRPVFLIPVVETTVTPHSAVEVEEIGERATWRLVGMDLVGLQNLRTAHLGAKAQQDVTQNSLITGDVKLAAPGSESGMVFISQAMAGRLGIGVDDELEVVIHDAVVTLRIGGIVRPQADAPSAPDNLLLMDLPDAQKLAAKDGKVDRVEVIAERGATYPKLREEAATLLEAAALGRWQVLRQEDRRAQAGTMTAGFRLNLTILSLLALLVGGYLIFQALDGVVLRRREEIGVLKALGVTDGSIKLAFLIEAALLGGFGGVLGTLLGWAGAQLAVVGVSRTVTALYGASSARHADLPWSEWLLGVLLCTVASLVAAWWPARQAAMTPPAWMLCRQTIVHGGGKGWRVEWLGWVLMLLAVAFAQCGPLRLASGLRVSLAGYAAALFWLLGAGLAAGSMLRFIAGQFKGAGAVSRVALSHLRKPSVRHRFALAALSSAVAMTAGMAVLVGSFDKTMRGWIERSMQADLYVASAGAQSASSTSGIAPQTVAAMRTQPEVAELAVIQNQSVVLHGGPAWVLGVEPEYAQRHDLLSWAERPEIAEWWRLGKGEPDVPALISESFSERFMKHRGDTFEVPAPSGIHRIKIVGVYADYGNERGSISVPRAVFHAWFGQDYAWRVAILLKPGADAERVRSRLVSEHPGLAIYTNEHLRRESLRIFRQTFSVTYAMEAIGVIVAVAGLGLALASLLLERREDLHTLRSLGMTAREIARACAIEGCAIATCGVAMGLASGLWLGWLLIYVVNKQTFGWTLGFAVPVGQLLALGTSVIAVGAIVAAVVGTMNSRMSSERLREE